jgi:hypothetical protein
VETTTVIGALSALAHESRLGIFRLLVEQGPEGLPAGEIASRLRLANANASFHLNHLGMQAEDDAELEAIHANLQKADATVLAEKDAHCCYARSDKYWVTDPQGIAWESFRSLGSIPLFGDGETDPAGAENHASCGSGEAAAASCCTPAESKAAPAAIGSRRCCTQT